MTKQLEKATFAGGCFWCMVKPFDEADLVSNQLSQAIQGVQRKILLTKRFVLKPRDIMRLFRLLLIRVYILMKN